MRSSVYNGNKFLCFFIIIFLLLEKQIVFLSFGSFSENTEKRNKKKCYVKMEFFHKNYEMSFFSASSLIRHELVTLAIESLR